MPDQTKQLPEQGSNQPVPKRPSISIDYALYQKYLDDADLSESQKRAFLDALWSVVVSFVDLGFGVHPVQQADACGQNLELQSFIASDVVNSNKPKSQNQPAKSTKSGNRSGAPQMNGRKK